MIKVSFS